MQPDDIHRLIALNGDFYRAHHESFSTTRQNAWPGWERAAASFPTRPSTVLDVACGNLRFKAFLDDRLKAPRLRYFAIDSCDELLPEGHDARFQRLDIIGELAKGTPAAGIEAPASDIAVCFGFMHHVPTNELRMRLLDALVAKTAPGGMLAVSFWQFARDPRMREKALQTTARGQAALALDLEEGDYLLGWNDVKGAYRYCHSFADAEIDRFVQRGESQARCVDRFRADGRSNEMNGYLVFRKC